MNPYIIVVDLELTCCDRKILPLEIPDGEREVIEIGAAALHVETRQVVSDFSVFVRPTLHPKLTQYCTDLTSIRQDDVDNAPGLICAFPSFQYWANSFTPWTFASWGKDYDWLSDDLRRNGFHWNACHPINLAVAWQQKGVRGKCGSRKAMKRLGVAATGRHHRGVDDAKNIAALAAKMLELGMLSG